MPGEGNPHLCLGVNVCQRHLHTLKDRSIEWMHVSEGLIERLQGSWQRCLHIAAVLPQLALQLPLYVSLQVAPTLCCGNAGDHCCKDMVLVCLRQPENCSQAPCLVCMMVYAPVACQPLLSAMTSMLIFSRKVNWKGL